MNRKHTKALYILSCASLLLPWFSFNPTITGCCKGTAFILWFALAADFVLMAIALGLWQEVFNIREGFQWLEGLQTAYPGYWISLGLFASLWIVYQKEQRPADK